MANKVIVNGLNIGYLPPSSSEDILYSRGGGISTKDAIDSKVSKSGDTMNGNLSIDSGKTGETPQMSRLILGNNKASGVDGKSMGSILMYGSNSNYVNIVTDNITSDRMIKFPNNNGTVALTSDLGICDTLLDVKTIPTTAQSYNCNWNLYYFIIISATFYSNICDQLIVPTSYFSGTAEGRRLILNNTSYNKKYSIWQNGYDKVYIVADSSSDIYGVSIYGIMKKPA